MPILIRPVREQLEHDRVIRLLQAKWKRKFEVQINVGEEKTASVKVGPSVFYPDLVLLSTSMPRKVQGLVEVETGESVNNLEAMAQWANFARVRAPFQLYVPAGSYDIARRLCEEHHVVPAELWTFIQLGEQIRFTLAQKNASTEPPRPEKAEKPEKPAKAPKAAKAEKPAKGARPEKPAKAAKGKGGKAEKPGSARGAKPRPPARAAKPAAGRPPAKKAAARPAPARKVTKAKPVARPAAGRSAKRR